MGKRVRISNPYTIVSDRGSAFTSNACKEFLEVNMMEQICTTTGVARGNGQVERVNRCIIDILAKLCSDEPAKWYKYMPRVQMAINSHVHLTTLSMPFEIIFGTKMCTKVDDRLLDMMQGVGREVQRRATAAAHRSKT